MTSPSVPLPAGWLPATRQADGLPFWIVPAAKGTAVYYTTADGCTCPDARHRGRTCKHQRAARTLLTSSAHREHVAVAPRPRPTYEDLFPACKGGCGDIGDGRDGYCDRCASEREYQQRMATRQTARATEAWL